MSNESQFDQTSIINKTQNKEIEEISFRTQSKRIFPWVSYILISINIFAYILELIVFYLFRSTQPFYCTVYSFGAKDSNSIIQYSQLWRFIMPIILHGSFIHLLMNSISLYHVGFKVEGIIGSKCYSLLYIISGVYSNLISSVFSSESITVGASGSLMGLCGFLTLYFILNYVRMNWKEKRSAVIFLSMLSVNLALLHFASNIMKTDTIDNSSHYGGYITGLLLSVFTIDDETQLHSKVKQVIQIVFIAFLVLIPLYCFFCLYMIQIPVNNLRGICYSH